MKRVINLILALIGSLVLSSCGAIPTLPPLDSTVTVRTPQYTFVPGLPTDVEPGNLPSSTPTASESTIKPQKTLTETASPTHTKVPPTTAPSNTPTAALTATSSSSPTPRATRTPTAAPTSTAVPYSLQVMNPYYLANFTHPDLGCDWMGVAGQVFNKAGVVQKEILIKAGGKLNGNPVQEEMTMPLSEPEVDLAYGPGGYELTLADSPTASENVLWVQLFNLEGDPISGRVFITTHDDCQKNLVLLNFVEK